MEYDTLPPRRRRHSLLILSILIFLLGVGGYLFGLNRPPESFPVPYQFTIDPGQSLFSISGELQAEGAIQSRRLLEFWMLLFGTDRAISEGEYYFTKPATVFQMALRITGRQFGIDRKRVTFPEGFTSTDMAARLSETFTNFDGALFLNLAKEHEGYLFPDTYAFFPSVTPDVVVTTLRKNFERRVLPLEAAITASGRTKEEVITMASLVEREANGTEDRAMVAGILWRRFDEGKLLQVDAPFAAFLGKTSSELTRSDLLLDAPFNTYKHVGLPPVPIANPGVAAIEATVYPTASPYLFYLHDADGTIHYARTYAEHLKNITRFLKNRK
ncbi:MAG TPA: endolytic transglycosylase MltG [Candidatus Paceibacterota bacterium]|nr:endolytic transglycosylase MltG [Candidatus Paceibacterota bacterium]